jgi:hypothetical protein
LRAFQAVPHFFNPESVTEHTEFKDFRNRLKRKFQNLLRIFIETLCDFLVHQKAALKAASSEKRTKNQEKFYENLSSNLFDIKSDILNKPFQRTKYA